MVKRRKKPQKKPQGSLPLWYPSPPSRLGKYVIYFKKLDKFGVMIFAACYAATKFLELLIGEDDYDYIRHPEKFKTEDLDGHRIQTDSNMQIWGVYLREMLEHEYTAKEEEFELPDEYHNTVEFYRSDRPAPKRSQVSETKKKSSRPSRDGLVTIGDIADELEITPREARAKLRGKISKPAAGWAWPSDEVDKIKELISS